MTMMVKIIGNDVNSDSDDGYNNNDVDGNNHSVDDDDVMHDTVSDGDDADDAQLIILVNVCVVDTHIVKQIKAICHDHAEQGSKDSLENLEKIFLTKSPMQALYNLEVCDGKHK